MSRWQEENRDLQVNVNVHTDENLICHVGSYPHPQARHQLELKAGLVCCPLLMWPQVGPSFSPEYNKWSLKINQQYNWRREKKKLLGYSDKFQGSPWRRAGGWLLANRFPGPSPRSQVPRLCSSSPADSNPSFLWVWASLLPSPLFPSQESKTPGRKEEDSYVTILDNTKIQGLTSVQIHETKAASYVNTTSVDFHSKFWSIWILIYKLPENPRDPAED